MLAADSKLKTLKILPKQRCLNYNLVFFSEQTLQSHQQASFLLVHTLFTLLAPYTHGVTPNKHKRHHLHES